MTFNRYARKSDEVQDDLVRDLRAWGYIVSVIGRPVDLAVRHREWPPGLHLLMECKTPGTAGARGKRKDQEEQTKFIAETGVPVVTSFESALEALRKFLGVFR